MLPRRWGEVLHRVDAVESLFERIISVICAVCSGTSRNTANCAMGTAEEVLVASV